MSLNLSKICIVMISFYQRYLSFDRGVLMFLAPGGACKHVVSCSEYTKEMITEYGAIIGIYKGIQRIISCR